MIDRAHRHGRVRRAGLLFGVAFLLAAVPGRGQSLSGQVRSEVAARGLSGPAGVAVHPETGEVYVAEAGANRISVIRNAQAVPVISTGWRVQDGLPRWAIRPNTPESFWTNPTLREPTALAFGPAGNLFVLEGGGDGRLFEFFPDERGGYPEARVYPIAWLSKTFTWRDIRVSPSTGNLFICGNVEGNRHLHFGSVLMKDTKNDWWVVDYGPFIHFSGLDLSRDGDILLVGEQGRGGLAWWDVVNHLPLGEIQETTAENAQASVITLLPDGSFAAVHREPGGVERMHRVDPFSGRVTTLVEGVQRFGSVITEPGTRNILVTDREAGVLYRCSIQEGVLSDRYMVEQSRDARQTREGYTPRETPTFLRDFLLSSGALRTEGEDVAPPPEEDQARIDWQEVSFSLREFARYIPLIAGSLRLEPLDDDIADPVEVIEFVTFFPGSVIVQGREASPSMTFFFSRRRSGRTEATRRLFSGTVISRAGDLSRREWSKAAETASTSVPLATVHTEQRPEGRTIDLVFLGLGIYHDYYANLMVGIDDRGEVVVEDVDGRRERYRAIFSRVDEQGRVFRNLVIAGFDPADDLVDTIGWLNIGYSPVGTALSTSDQLHRFGGAQDALGRMVERRSSLPAQDDNQEDGQL